MSSGDITFTAHDCLGDPSDKPVALLKPSTFGKSNVLVLRAVDVLPMGDAYDRATLWGCTGRMQYCFPDESGSFARRSPEMMKAVATLVETRAFPGTDCSVSVSASDLLDSAWTPLLDSGYVARVDSSAADARVQLSASGTAALRYGSELMLQGHIFRPRAGVALRDRTVLECVVLLEEVFARRCFQRQSRHHLSNVSHSHVCFL